MYTYIYTYIYICIHVLISYLVGGLEPWNFMTFHILGIVTPTDFHIFQRGRSSTNQICICRIQWGIAKIAFTKDAARQPANRFGNFLFPVPVRAG